MPGAYEKQMHGEHYELILKTVQKCEQLLEAESYEPLRLEIPLLLLLQGDRSKTVIEEFCYAGGFRLMFQILQLRGTNPSIGDVTPILNNLSSLLSIEFDPFDDDVGRIPLLVYFLCERHTHYVDIQWSSDDLILMKEFIMAHLSVISSMDTIAESDRILALNNLYGALLSYPPHRVVQSAANVFTPENCASLLTSLRRLPSLWKHANGRTKVIQLILAAASFGLGLVITSDIPHSQLLMTVNRQLVPELRCPCGRCEFFRRLQRVAKERDEFGVPKASEAKKTICYSFVKAGIHQFIANFFDDVHQSFSRNTSKNQLHDVRDTAVIEDDKIAPSTSSTMDVTTSTSESSTLDEIVCNELDTNDSHIDDKSKLLATQLIWLCSWPCEEIHGSSILAIENFLLTKSLLKSLDLSDLRQTFNPQTGEFLPGVRGTIETLCTLTLRAEGDELKSLSSRLRPTIEALLQRCCTQLVESSGHLSRQWNPSMAIFAPVLSVMLTCVYIATANDTPPSLKHRRRRSPTVTTPTTSILSDPLLTACTDACKCLVDGYEWGGCQIDERVFIESLLQSMAVLTNRLEYSRCPEARRRLLSPPHASCGYMASSGRWLLDRFDSSVAKGEGCIIIRTLGSVVISRAEQAVALQVPTTKTTTSSSLHSNNEKQLSENDTLNGDQSDF